MSFRLATATPLAAALLLMAVALTPQPGKADQPLVIVELFTSQGCSSCPPADALMANIASDNVVPLSYFVDYWDYIGWKDTFANPRNTRRQKAYAAARGTGRIYTPQVVIQGKAQGVGSNRAGINRMISQAQRPSRNTPVAIARNHNTIEIDLDDPANATNILTLVGYQTAERVNIGAGENRGRAIDYTHIVRGFHTLKNRPNPSGKIAFKLDEIEKLLNISIGKGNDQVDGLVALLQSSSHGAIIGAARLKL